MKGVNREDISKYGHGYGYSVVKGGHGNSVEYLSNAPPLDAMNFFIGHLLLSSTTEKRKNMMPIDIDLLINKLNEVAEKIDVPLRIKASL